MIAETHDGDVPFGAMAEMRASFGMAVRLLRTERGWNLRTAAKELGLSLHYMWELEKGVANPSLEIQEKVAQGFGISLFDLMRSTEEQRVRRQARRAAGEEVEMPPPPRVRTKRAAAVASAEKQRRRKQRGQAEEQLPSVAACYIVRAGRLLMVRRRFREGTLVWAGPSGEVEPGETPEAAAIREVREEVGLEIEVIERLGDRVQPASGRHLIYFACRVISGEADVVDHEEIAAVEWCDWPTVEARWADLKGGIFPPVREYLTRELVGGQSEARSRGEAPGES